MLTPKIVQGLSAQVMWGYKVGTQTCFPHPSPLFPPSAPPCPNLPPLRIFTPAPLPRKRRVISPYYLSLSVHNFQHDHQSCKIVGQFVCLFVRSFVCMFWNLTAHSSSMSFRAGQFTYVHCSWTCLDLLIDSN